MKNLFTIIKKPLFTEKGSALKEAENKLLVEVTRDANKIEIKKAIEEIFKVKVEKVATIKSHGKWKRQVKKTGGRNNYGRVTMWQGGGGNSRRYRIIDFKRNKTGVPAVVATIEYDPNTSARILLLHSKER